MRVSGAVTAASHVLESSQSDQGRPNATSNQLLASTSRHAARRTQPPRASVAHKPPQAHGGVGRDRADRREPREGGSLSQRPPNPRSLLAAMRELPEALQEPSEGAAAPFRDGASNQNPEVRVLQ